MKPWVGQFSSMESSSQRGQQLWAWLLSPGVRAGYISLENMTSEELYSFDGCCCSVAQSCPTLCDPIDCKHIRLPCPSPPPGACSNSHPLNWWCHPTILSSVIPFFSCLHTFQASVSFLIKSVLCTMWPNYWNFSFSISPSSEFLGLISFRTDWFDILAVQGTLKSLLQHHNLKAPILQSSAFFIVQLLHPSMTTGKTMALTRHTCW